MIRRFRSTALLAAALTLTPWLSGCADRNPSSTIPTESDNAPIGSAPAGASTAPAPTAAHPAGGDTANAAAAQRRRQAMRASIDAVHGYLQAVGKGEFEQADAYWAYRRSPSTGEESGLRTLSNLRSLRIDNRPPVALDEDPVPATVEVPVRLVATLSDRQVIRLDGWYRVRRNPVEDRWELYGASLRPVLR